MRDSREHGARRKLFARAFSKSALRRDWEGVVREKAELAVRRMGEESKRLGKVDVLKWWTFLASDVLGELAFGESFGNLERGEKNQFIGVLEKVMMGSGIGVELPFVAAIGRLTPSRTLQTLFNGRDLILEYGAKAVETTRSQAGVKNIFAKAISTADEGADTLTDLDIRIEAANFIVAGKYGPFLSVQN